MFEFIVFVIAIVAGFGTGLLGIGGGLIIFPAFLFVLPILGYEALPITKVTGIATIQVVTGSFFALMSHRRDIKLSKKILAFLAIFAGLGSMTGAIASAYVPEKVLLSIYLFILFLAYYYMAVYKIDNSDIQVQETKSNNFLTNILYFFSGMLMGALGVGGAVLYTPLLRTSYKLPTKDCVSCVVMIVFLASLMTLTGKIITAQIPYELIIYTLAGSFIGAKLGARVSRKLGSEALKRVLVAIIVITAVRVAISLFS